MTGEPDNCEHQWGEAELCETRVGNIMSPTCQHCGAVKVLEQQRRTVVRPPAPAIQTNIPPAGAPRVHPFQTELFTNL